MCQVDWALRKRVGGVERNKNSCGQMGDAGISGSITLVARQRPCFERKQKGIVRWGPFTNDLQPIRERCVTPPGNIIAHSYNFCIIGKETF